MNHIDTLLNSYFEGSTTTEEEKILKKYFASDTVAPQHELWKPLFHLYEQEKEMVSAPRFFIPAKQEKRKRSPSRQLWIASASVAAVIFLFIILTLKGGAESKTDYVVIVNGKRITNPQKAKVYAETMFTEVCNIKKESCQPMLFAKEIQEKYNAAKIIGEAKKGTYLLTTRNQ